METKFMKSAAAVTKFLVLCSLLVGACALTFSIARFFAGDSKAASTDSAVQIELPVIVIDAGHGGIDGGAVGIDGSLEKEINLAVAEKLAELCRLAGHEVVMTRTDDHMLTDESAKSHRKMHDLKNRLAVVQELTDAGRETMFVSIHMNNFSASQYSGLQVWYSAADERSREMAQYVQSYTKTFLDPANTREIKKATSAIYILDHIQTPAILIECGFLSNPEECAKLATEEYQKELAVTIFAALMESIAKNTQ